MKIAYSLLLSEYIPADQLDYQDYSRFLIACPSCYEPLFKVVRSPNDKLDTQHFYSHYGRTKAFNEECELRCKSISARQIHDTAVVSRGQKLLLFLSTLHNQVALDLFDTPNDFKNDLAVTKSADLVRTMLASRPLTDYLDSLFHYLRTLKHDLLILNVNFTFDSYLQQLAEQNRDPYQTTFSIEVQKRIATEILKHILTLKGQPSFNFVACHAYRHVTNNIELTRQTIPTGSNLTQIYKVMEKLPVTGRKQGNRIQKELKAATINWAQTAALKPTLLEQTNNLWEEMSIRILLELVAILLRLPYFEILQAAYDEKKRSNPPHHQQSPS